MLQFYPRTFTVDKISLSIHSSGRYRLVPAVGAGGELRDPA